MASAFDQRNRPIQGQLLRLSRRRQVAIYLYDDALWIADFIDGEGEIVEAKTWFRFHCASALPSQMRRRMVVESGLPLSADIVAKIEQLHGSAREASAVNSKGHGT